MLVDDDGDELEDQHESPAKPAVLSGAARGRRTVLEDSSDEEMEDAQPQLASGVRTSLRRGARNMLSCWLAYFAGRVSAALQPCCLNFCSSAGLGCRMAPACCRIKRNLVLA